MVAKKLILALVLALSTNAAFAADAAADAKLVPLKLELPKLAFIGTPADMQMDEHIEPPSETNRPPVLMVPAGTVNLASNKKATCSDKNPSAGGPRAGDRWQQGGHAPTASCRCAAAREWVQIDLEQPAAISYILVWHAHNAAQIYKCVVIQIADDADFTQNVRTVYNNDYENKAGLGIGKDKQYFESFEGRWIPVKNEKARYVRGSRGQHLQRAEPDHGNRRFTAFRPSNPWRLPPPVR